MNDWYAEAAKRFNDDMKERPRFRVVGGRGVRGWSMIIALNNAALWLLYVQHIKEASENIHV